MTDKRVYYFGDSEAEGKAEMKNLLGGKGANLAEMTNLGIPVPPGFTITTEVCSAYDPDTGRYPDGLEQEVEDALARVEKALNKTFGDPGNPLPGFLKPGPLLKQVDPINQHNVRVNLFNDQLKVSIGSDLPVR